MTQRRGISVQGSWRVAPYAPAACAARRDARMVNSAHGFSAFMRKALVGFSNTTKGGRWGATLAFHRRINGVLFHKKSLTCDNAASLRLVSGKVFADA